jgi:hypothetical protein
MNRRGRAKIRACFFVPGSLAKKVEMPGFGDIFDLIMKWKPIERLLLFGGQQDDLPEISKPRMVLEYFIFAGVVALLGYVDYLTGFEVLIFSFYLIPIRFASTRLGLAGGMVISMCAVLAWGMSDYFAGAVYSSQLVVIWNMLIRLASFFTVAWLSARNASLLAEERATSARLRKALSEIKLLQGLLPICASCKKIRDEKGEWNVLENYMQQHADITFSHGLCPDCARQWAKEAEIEGELE